MAKPIKETPVLRNVTAKRFLKTIEKSTIDNRMVSRAQKTFMSVKGKSSFEL